MYKWTMEGKIAHRFETTPKNIYSISVNDGPNSLHKVISVAGASDLIDLYSSLGHRSFSLKVDSTA